MFTTYNFFKGLFVILNVIFDTANANRFQGKLPDLSLISSFFKMFIEPHFKTWHSEPIPRAFERLNRIVENIVRQKIKELQPYLQDDDATEAETDNEITFDGNNETTIIEFKPPTSKVHKLALRNVNDTFKMNMRKYKRVRNKIYEALEAERVSDKTKMLIIRTLDELLSKMIETQCHWKGSLYDTADDMKTRFIIPRAIVSKWRDEWQKFKGNFSNLTRIGTKSQDNNVEALMEYLNRLNNIINDVSANLETFGKKYKIRCNIFERKEFKKNKSTRQKHESLRFYDSDDGNKCKNFKVCSRELRNFFIDFYQSVNETSVNVLRSYAEMFTRDVNTDVSDEKSSIVDLIFKIADRTEKDVAKIFVRHTRDFQLDHSKRKEANINILLDYVKNVIKDIKDEAGKNVLITLNHLRKRVFFNIQQDLQTNFDIDLGNLKRDFEGKICLVFNICRGNLKYRRHGDYDIENSIENDNKIYVKVALTIDEKNEDLLKTNSHNDKRVPELNPEKNAEKKLLNYVKYANISVTRTTLVA